MFHKHLKKLARESEGVLLILAGLDFKDLTLVLKNEKPEEEDEAWCSPQASSEAEGLRSEAGRNEQVSENWGLSRHRFFLCSKETVERDLIRELT